MSHEPLVKEKLNARQSLEAQAIIRLLLPRIATLAARVAELEGNVLYWGPVRTKPYLSFGGVLSVFWVRDMDEFFGTPTRVRILVSVRMGAECTMVEAVVAGVLVGVG